MIRSEILNLAPDLYAGNTGSWTFEVAMHRCTRICMTDLSNVESGLSQIVVCCLVRVSYLFVVFFCMGIQLQLFIDLIGALFPAFLACCLSVLGTKHFIPIKVTLK